MKVLLTGATGFLGKHVLNRLIADNRIERIDIVSRSKKTHPSPKAKTIAVDLSEPTSLNALSGDVDAAIHLAGLYDFHESLPNAYTNNVLATVNLIDQLREWNRQKRVPLYYASTYGVGYGLKGSLAEQPLDHLPSKDIPYVYTKAVAERAVTDSGLPGAVLRLGILVGTTSSGQIEKLDGPYPFLKFLQSLNRLPVARLLKAIPVFGKKDAVLPFVPVDIAARVFHDVLFRDHTEPKMSVYGAFEPTSVSVSEFCESVLPDFLPTVKPIYLENTPQQVLKWQALVTGISGSTFRFSLEPVGLDNREFSAAFPECTIPHFTAYRNAFLSGFHSFVEGRS